MPYYSDTPPDEEIDPNAQDEEDYLSGTPFLSQDQAMARNDLLSPALPQAVAPLTTRGTGEASREYATGRPGLFVQGGAGVPAGMLEVNGQLERSQAAPQPVPWWITQADEFKEQRRQEDLLTRLVQASQAQGERQGGMAIERAQQLQARMNVANKVKQGMPLRDALASEPNIYGSRNVPSITHLATARQPVKPATGVTEVTGPSGNVYFQGQGFRPLPAVKGQRTGLSPEGQLRAIDMRLKHLDKEEENNPRNKDVLAKVAAERTRLTDMSNKLLGVESPAEPAEQTQTSPRVALANQLATQHPDWPKEKIIEAVRKQLK